MPGVVERRVVRGANMEIDKIQERTLPDWVPSVFDTEATKERAATYREYLWLARALPAALPDRFSFGLRAWLYAAVRADPAYRHEELRLTYEESEAAIKALEILATTAEEKGYLRAEIVINKFLADLSGAKLARDIEEAAHGR